MGFSELMEGFLRTVGRSRESRRPRRLDLGEQFLVPLEDLVLSKFSTPLLSGVMDLQYKYIV